MISIVDPGVPDWIEIRTKEMLPRLFAFYTDRFAVSLPERPTILFHFTSSDISGYSSGGGTLPALVQLGLEGKAWENESAEGLLHQFHFLAHEAAHLWNGQLIHYDGTEDSWMHEGSADALAQRTLQALGLITEERFRTYQTVALNECLQGLGRSSLRSAHERGAFRDYYSCGNMVALLTEKALSIDLFEFWRRLIERARSDDGMYEADDYFAVLESAGASAEEVAMLHAHRRSPATFGALFLQSGSYFRMRFERTPEGLRIVEASLVEGERQTGARDLFVNVASAAGLNSAIVPSSAMTTMQSNAEATAAR